MPNRGIKESILTSETIRQLSPEAERFFYRLLLVCDDFGRAEAEPIALRSRCFPIDPRVNVEDVARWRRELEDVGLIVVYQVGRREYLAFVNWGKHQRCRAKASKFPAPPADLLRAAVERNGGAWPPDDSAAQASDDATPSHDSHMSVTCPTHDGQTSDVRPSSDGRMLHEHEHEHELEHEQKQTPPPPSPTDSAPDPELERLVASVAVEHPDTPVVLKAYLRRFRPSKRRTQGKLKESLMDRISKAAACFDEALQELTREELLAAIASAPPMSLWWQVVEIAKQRRLSQPKSPSPPPQPARRVRYLIGGPDGEVSAA